MMMEIIINDTKLVLEKDHEVVTIECYDAAIAHDLAAKIALEQFKGGN